MNWQPDTYFGAREYAPSVWCVRFMACDGIGVPGWRGDRRAELCDRCNRVAYPGDYGYAPAGGLPACGPAGGEQREAAA